jgi:hypothetical protein
MKERMVFVLGPGASNPYGYPLAKDLVWDIATNSLPANSCLDQPAHIHHYRVFRDNLANSKAPSVDVFLGRDSQRRFETVGKLAIAENLILKEDHSAIFHNRTIDDDWLGYLFNTLTAGIRRLEDVGKLPISFITFNYDRVLEHFLVHYLTSNFPDNNTTDVAAVIRQIPIIHAYGSLGPLQWLDEGGREYSPTITPELVSAAADRLTIMHEGDNKIADFDRAQRLFKKAYLIWLVGFGYHPENMRRLKLPFDRANKSKDRVYIRGTAFNMTVAESNHVLDAYGHGQWELSDPAYKITDALRNSDLFLNCAR